MVIAPALPSPKPKPRIIVYIDGLNLYYGVLQQVPAEKWLEVKTRTLCKKRKGCGTRSIVERLVWATRPAYWPGYLPKKSRAMSMVSQTPWATIGMARLRREAR